MREILFRGKRIDNGEWVEGFYISHLNSCHYIIPCRTGGYEAMDYSFYVHKWYAVDPSTVGQYTGKTVKTGKVFDGDIGRSVDGLFLVCWDEEAAAFMMRFDSYPYETLHIEEMWDDAEIIGNIHDNPELMEVHNE